MIDLKPGDMAILTHCKADVGLRKIWRLTDTRIVAHGGECFLRSTGKKVGGDTFIRKATPEEIAAMQAKLDEEKRLRIESEDRKCQEAYDALPEAEKLARTLSCFCDSSQDKEVAKMPIQILRDAVAWIQKKD